MKRWIKLLLFFGGGALLPWLNYFITKLQIVPYSVNNCLNEVAGILLKSDLYITVFFAVLGLAVYSLAEDLK